MEYVITSIELKTFDGKNQEVWTIEEIYKFIKEEIEILGLGKIEEFKVNMIAQIPVEENQTYRYAAMGEVKKVDGKIIFEDKLYGPLKPEIYLEDTKCLVKGTHITITKIG